MIWAAGKIVEDDALKISVLDRTFEHGLGLFETFRTWNRHPTLLPRHLARLQHSAQTLRLPLDSAALPDAEAVAALLDAGGFEGDALFRLTLTGGWDDGSGSVVFLKASPLPPPLAEKGAVLLFGDEVRYDDPLVRHKTLNYWGRRLAFEAARAEGGHEALSWSRKGRVWEGTRTNLFVIYGPFLGTPGADGPIVPGIMRGVVLERAAKLGFEVGEGELGEWHFQRKGLLKEVFLTNSVRGIVPAARALGRKFPCPGPETARLWEDVLAWLNRGGIDI